MATPLRLSNAEIDRVADVTSTILGTSGDAVDEDSRRRVIAHVLELTGADRAHWMFPYDMLGRPLTLVNHLSTRWPDQYREMELYKIDQGSARVAARHLQVYSTDDVVAGDWHQYDNDIVTREIMAPFGMLCILGLAVHKPGPPAGNDSLLSMFNLASAHRFSVAQEHRTRQILRVLYPAFRAAAFIAADNRIRQLTRWHDLDALPVAVRVVNEDAQALHDNPALRALLDATPADGTINAALGTLARRLRTVAGGPRGSDAHSTPWSATCTNLRGRTFALALFSLPGRNPAPAEWAITVQPAVRTQPTAQDLADRFGLTRRESEVASRLARGLANDLIAAELGLSAHTVRHHTERVLAKLGARSRAAACARLCDSC